MNKVIIKILQNIGLLIFLTSCSDFNEYLGNDFTYAHESNEASFIFHRNRSLQLDIPCAVIDYEYNENFIVAFQDNNYACLPNDIQTRYNFWIIDKVHLIRYGPLDLNRYFFLSDSLCVPKNFQLIIRNINHISLRN